MVEKPKSTQPDDEQISPQQEGVDPATRTRRLERSRLESKIFKKRQENSEVTDNIALTKHHYTMIEATSQELLAGEAWEDKLRFQELCRRIDRTMVGSTTMEYWDPPMPELSKDSQAAYPQGETFQKYEETFFEGVRVVREVFTERFVTIRHHLVEEIITTIPDKNSHLALRALANDSNENFFTEITLTLINQMAGAPLSETQTKIIESHLEQYEIQKRLLNRKLRRLDRDFAQAITLASGETVNEIHKDFLGGLQDALDHFGKQDADLNAPIIALLEEFRQQIEAAPGEEILKAVRKMYILTTFDKDKAGAAYLTSFTLTRALVLGLIKNYWESSGRNIIDFQNRLKTWWVKHVNRPSVNEDGAVEQVVVSPMLNSERGSYFTMFSLEDKKQELLHQVDQLDAVAILARQQLLSTLINPERNQALDILDGWTHTDMPIQPNYAVVIHRGKHYKKVFFTHEDLQNIDQFITRFKEQFADKDSWKVFVLTPEQVDSALSGKTTIQEAKKRKFLPDDPTSADTSISLLLEDDEVPAEDIVQRGLKSWTHGSAIKFSLSLFVDKQGRLTGKGAQKGAHAWTDGRVSTIKLQNSLVESATLFEMLAAKKSNPPENIDPNILTTGAENINHEQESPVQIAQFERQKYQQRIQKLFDFFKQIEPPEMRFTFDINGLISSAVMITLNDVWQLSRRKGVINNIQFLERAKFVRSGVQIGDSLTPVPLQFNNGMQDKVRSLAPLLQEYGSDLARLSKGENISQQELRNLLRRVVLSFAFFDEERRLVRAGNPGIIAVMAEMAGKVRKPLTFASGITSRELTDMAINTVLISSLVPSRPRTQATDNDINIESFSTALDEVYNNFGFVIAASSFGQDQDEKISVVVRQMNEVIAPVLDGTFKKIDPNISLQSLIERNMDKVLTVLEAFMNEYQRGQHD